jgi:hypothetical protein
MKKILLFVILFFVLERACYLATGGFAPYKIRAERCVDGSCQIPSEIKEILKQPFFYLGKGVQFYVFLGEDGKTVLKFVKQQCSRPSDWIASLRGDCTKQERRHRDILESCEISHHLLKEETALLFAHLHPQQGSSHLVHLFDKLNIEHQIDLNETSFVLQRYADSFFSTFQNYRKEGSLESARRALDSLITLIEKRSQQGIINTDARLRNFGFIEGRAVETDIGSFKRREGLGESVKCRDEKNELKKWLTLYYPELL